MLKLYPKGKRFALIISISVTVFYVISSLQALSWHDSDRFLSQLIIAPFGIAIFAGIAFLLGAFFDVVGRKRQARSSSSSPVMPEPNSSSVLPWEHVESDKLQKIKPTSRPAEASQGLSSMSPKNALLFITGGIAISCLILLLSGHGILVEESETYDHAQIYSDGATYRIGNVEVSSDVMNSLASSHYFTCSYFSGRGTVQLVLDARDGYRQCPFLNRL